MWLACHLAGLSGGAWWGQGSPVPLAGEGVADVVRASALLPALLPLTGTGGAALIWLGVTAAGGVAGLAWRQERAARHSAFAPLPWAPAEAQTRRGAAVVRVTGWADPTATGRWRGPARLLEWHGEVHPAAPGILLEGEGPPPAPGSLWAGVLALRAPSAAAVPGGFDDRAFLAGRGLTWRGRWEICRPLTTTDIPARLGAAFLAPLRADLIARLDGLLPPRERDLAAAVLLGVRTPRSRATAAPFAGLGLAHLFAVSGLHVGILLGLVLAVPRLAGWSPAWALLPVLVFVPVYALLTGLPGSVVRAGGMGLLAATARPAGRRADALHLLGILFWCGSLWDPVRNQDTGLQLSYMAAAGILLVGRATDGFRTGCSRAGRVVVGGLLVSFAAQWFTLPVVARAFGMVSPLSPIANLVAVPAFGAAVWSITLGMVGGAIWAPLGTAAGALGWTILRALSGAVAGCAGAPSWGLPPPGPLQVGIWAVATVGIFGLLRLSGRFRRLAALLTCGLLVALTLGSFGPAAYRLGRTGDAVAWQFDVGQGDCALLRLPDGWTALIDTGGRFSHLARPEAGPAGRTIVPFLHRWGLRRLNAVILTHGHLDHTGGAAAIGAACAVDSWWVAGLAHRDVPPGSIVRTPRAGEVLHRSGSWTLVVAHPLGEPGPTAQENDRSLVLALCRDAEVEMVWSGDLEAEGERRVLAAGTLPSPARVWKAGHHGSATSGTTALLGHLRPELILVSCGVANRHGHPSHGPYLNPATGDTIPLLRTDLDGSIRLQWGPDGRLRWSQRGRQGEFRGSP